MGIINQFITRAPFCVPSICHTIIGGDFTRSWLPLPLSHGTKVKGGKKFPLGVETVKFDRFGGDTFHHNPTASLQDLKSRNVRVSEIRPLASKTTWSYCQATSFCLVETWLY